MYNINTYTLAYVIFIYITMCIYIYICVCDRRKERIYNTNHIVDKVQSGSKLGTAVELGGLPSWRLQLPQLRLKPLEGSSHFWCWGLRVCGLSFEALESGC